MATLTTDEIRTRDVITVDELGELLGVSRGSAYKAVQTGEVKSLKIGRRILIPVRPLLALLGVDDRA